jgi:hypothetical protein
MRTLFTTPLAFFLIAISAFCGIGGYTPLGALLDKADQVVVATVGSSAASGNTLTLDLVTTRSLKGSTDVGSTIQATLSSTNVTEGSRIGLQMNGTISPSLLMGKTGLWFLQQSGAGWVVLPLMTGDIFTDGLYLPMPSGDLPSEFAYNKNATPKAKLIQEIGSAAQNPSTGVEFHAWKRCGYSPISARICNRC